MSEQEMIDSNTLTVCQHCGKVTNYADDASHKARVLREMRLLSLLQVIEPVIDKMLLDSIKLGQRLREALSGYEEKAGGK